MSKTLVGLKMTTYERRLLIYTAIAMTVIILTAIVLNLRVKPVSIQMSGWKT